MFKKILVAFDGSPTSCNAFDFALGIAKMCPGKAPEIIVLSVVQPPEPIDIVEMEAIIDSATQHYEELSKGLKDRAKKDGLEIKTEVVVGHSAGQIVGYATEKQCDHIIVGQRGKSRIAKWVLGSVSKRVAAYAPCTVTIVK